jgi:hypothetical protein
MIRLIQSLSYPKHFFGWSNLESVGMVSAMKGFRFLLPIVLLVSPLAHAQNQPAPTTNKSEDTEQPNRFWQASMSGGHFMVAIDRISSISRHEYVLNGNALVDEVTVDTLGQSLARFYFIRPLTDTMTGSNTGAAVARIAGRTEELVERAASIAGTNAHEKVIKTYPDTTHARSIEYRVQSAEALTALYNSVRTAWERGKGRRFTER